MSAESPIRSQAKATATSNVVMPQQVTDPTILDSMAGFINDVVPSAYTLPCDSKDQIQWARFEHMDNNCYTENVDCDKISHPPVLLVLGYTTGVQVWAIPANGESTEILSWRHGAVKVLRILPVPLKHGNNITDAYASKRPLIALCDNVTPGPDYCSLSFISLKTGEQVKLIKFKNSILDVIGNKRSVVVTFSERIAVFDACTLEDRLTITTCYLSPGLYPNPVALGTRWLAYAENKLIPSRRSSGGNDGEGVQSYTATVLHAAKSLGRGLRELGETVASSLTGNVPHKPGIPLGNPQLAGTNDILQKGVVTVLDIESQSINSGEKNIQTEAIIAHFTAHKEAVVCMSFDPSGLLLLTADKRGYDFHLFRIHPHPGGPALAAVHHLYILHRGDTTARVQDMCFSPDSRWVTVSTLRGTTHVFPITPYGGNVGVRTHATPHVVNKMSRFHRSAGLTAEGRSNSPVSLFEVPVNSNLPYHNPRLPPYPHPTVVQPLAQIRQPLFLQTSATQQRPSLGRQRLGSSSEDNIQVALRVCACFAPARAWLDPIIPTRETTTIKPQTKPVESLFIMSLHGSLIQYDLDPQHASSVPREKVCDDTLIELAVSAKAQWILQRQSMGKDMQLPLSNESLSYIYKEDMQFKNAKPDHTDDRWLSQVEIVTHAGPHRRLWMGPQFTFKTYNNGTGISMNILETQSIDVVRSKPVNMPLSAAYPILIEAGSVSSCEPSPKLLDTLERNFEEVGGAGEIQLREDLAEAMLESPGIRESGGRCVIVSMKSHNSGVAKVVNPLGMVVTVQSDEESELELPEEVIHENCDEALFRPVVASKAVVFAEPKNIQSKIATSVLHVNHNISNLKGAKLLMKNNTNDAVIKIATSPKVKMNVKNLTEGKDNKGNNKIHNSVQEENKKETATDVIENVLKTTKNNKIKGGDEKGNKKYDKKTKKAEVETQKAINSDIIMNKKEAEIKIIQDPFYDAIETCDDIECLDTFYAKVELEDMNFDEIFVEPKIDICEPRIDCSFDSQNMDTNSAVNMQSNIKSERDIISSSEENIEEKTLTKKVRKPKAKLGVRITNLSKEDTKEEESPPHVSPIRSWSSIASQKKPELDFTILEQSNDLPVIDDCKDFALKEENLLEPEKAWEEKTKLTIDDMFKNEKLSDENTSSSQTETTESDDSIKIPPIVMDTEDDPQVELIKPKVVTSGNKSKKSKKKRR